VTDYPSDTQAVIDIAREATQAEYVEPGVLLLLTDREGQQRLADTAEYGMTPRRDKRSVTVLDAPSLLDYVDRYAADDGDRLELWADEENLRVTAVLNAPSGRTPGWADHRAVLSLATAPEWDTWTRSSGRLMAQTGFAEHIEDNLPDIIAPPGAEMLELAQTFQANSAVVFQSSHWLDNGMRALEYREDVEAKAGKRGQITIPATFELALRPFLGADRYRVIARLRWRISDGHLTIGYKLDRPDEVLTAAFSDVAKAIAESVPVRVNSGRA
jgi:uncharacterized protein YfdQ (DUF2303 family)